MTRVAHDEIHWGRTRVQYSYTHADRKTLAISVHPDLAVTVIAPLETTDAEIRDRVWRRAAWVQKRKREFELYLPKQPPRRYVNGETHRYLGRQYRLKAMMGEVETAKCLRGYLWVTTPDPCDRDRIRTLVRGWLRLRAKAIFTERLEHCWQQHRAEGFPRPVMLIRQLNSRWGSCSPAGRIVLNTELIKAPKECIDYVITHELCHLKVPHHGGAFWRLLERLMPDYEARRQQLNMMADV